MNGEDIYDCHMDDPNGDDIGTWYYDLDTTKYDGSVEVTARGFSTADRYFTWAPSITINVNNQAANIPAVTISNPVEGVSLSGTIPVTVAVTGRNAISSVQVRINSGAWNTATWNGSNYVYNWNTTGIGNKTCSVEAKATDASGNAGYSMTTYAKVGTGTGESVVLSHPERGMWIWEPQTYDLLQNPGSRTVLDAFCKDTTFGTHTVKTLYLYADRYNGSLLIKDNPALYRNFIAWAHTNGYKVYALLASSMYCAPMYAYDRYHYKAVQLMENVINYNIASAANEKFDGVNSDIEPHGLADWPSKPVVQVQFLNMLNEMIQRRNAAAINLAFGPAIPRWLDENTECSNITWSGATKWEGNHIQDICDYISIMDYRDTATGPSGIISHAQGEIDYGNTIGKPNSVVIGVETDDIASSGDPSTITFSEEGRTALETELGVVYSTWGSSASFGGCAVHYYDSFRKLPSYWGIGGVSWTPPTDTTAPSAISGTPTAAVFDFQRIDLAFGSATDNTQIDGYNIYRSTTSGFTPNSSNLVGKTRLNFYKDWGLLASTAYYYKIAAVDTRGNIGPATAQVSATTGSTTLVPVKIAQMDLSYGGRYASLTIKVVNKNTGAGVTVAVHGRFTYGAGKYLDKNTSTSGITTGSSETIQTTHGQIGFAVDRIMGNGYYWAASCDTPHTNSCTW